MLDMLIELLQGLSALDDHAHMDTAPTWIRRYRTLIRAAYVLCLVPTCVLGLVWLVGWLCTLGATGWRVLGAIAVIQLLGILALLHRRRRGSGLCPRKGRHEEPDRPRRPFRG